MAFLPSRVAKEPPSNAHSNRHRGDRAIAARTTCEATQRVRGPKAKCHQARLPLFARVSGYRLQTTDFRKARNGDESVEPRTNLASTVTLDLEYL
jgi:hypothetical protein